ncbi:MAG: hypothetical protein NTY95_00800, partial [Bacteroidia bacterium]|nr:hypothetical protein [Bacteroidia bacterium]
MKYRILTILSLLLFTCTQAGPAVTTSNESIHPSPIYITDGVSLITSEMNNNRLDNLISLSKDIYPIQIGAFRLKTNAEKMFAKVARVLGNDVLMIEEDGFFKIRVTRLNKEKIRNYLEPEIKINNTVAEFRAPAITEDTIISISASTDSTLISDTKADTVIAPPLVAAVPAPALKPIEEPRRKFFLLNNESPWLKRINYFGKSFALVNALIITIFISIVTMIILLLVILLNRTRMEKEEDLKQYL